MVKIVTDSTSDIPPELAQRLGIVIVPLYVNFGNEAYRDGVDLSAEEFYRRLVLSRTLPTTSAASPGTFGDVYDRIAEETDEILFMGISSKLSINYESALKGKEQMKKNCRVEVVDSYSVVMGLGLMVLAAAEEAQAGAKLEQITSMVKEAVSKSHVRAAFDTLEYVRRGGRIGRAQALLGSVLKFNPIIGIKNGEVYPFGRERSWAKAVNWLYDFVAGFRNIRSLAVEYGTTPDEAEEFAQRLGSIFPRERIYISRISPVIGTHVGPHALAACVLEE